MGRFTLVAPDHVSRGVFRGPWFSAHGENFGATCNCRDPRVSRLMSRVGGVPVARKGNGMSAAEFDRVVGDLTAKIRGFIRRRVRDDATADDLTQETLLKVYRSRGALRDDQRIEAWLYRIARTT